MNRAQARETILNSGPIKAGDWLTASDVAAILGVSSSMASQILRKMAEDGILKMYRHNSGRTITVRYSKAPRNWASVTWRRRSNEQLGITV